MLQDSTRFRRVDHHRQFRPIHCRSADRGLTLQEGSACAGACEKGGDMRNGVIAVLAGAGVAVFAATAFAAEPTRSEKFRLRLTPGLPRERRSKRSPASPLTSASALPGRRSKPLPGKLAATPTLGPSTRTRFTRWEARRSRSPSR